MSEAHAPWIEAAEFDWTPQNPFRPDEPQFSDLPFPANDFREAWIARAPSHILIRLLIGALQGLGLALLTVGHGNPMAASAESMVLLFAPLILLAGWGQIPGARLLAWFVLAGGLLAALGAYRYWRADGQSGGGTLVLAALFLFIGQALVTGWRDGEDKGYDAYQAAAWNLVCLAAACGLVGALVALGAEAGANLLRQLYPGMHMTLPAMALVTLAVALTAALLPPTRLTILAYAARSVFMLALPVLCLGAVTIPLVFLFSHDAPPLLIEMGLTMVLIVGINASYAGGPERPSWRQGIEFLSSLAMGPLVALSAVNLQMRVAAWGWTSPRVFAAAALALLALYAIAYSAAALISLGGGDWMARLERANLTLALVTLAVMAALASPLADPAMLAAQSQLDRAQSGRISSDRFDFAYLAGSRARFGREALQHLALQKSRPDFSRAAFLALLRKPQTGAPPPTQIGANIHVRTMGGRLPQELLTADWAGVPQAPPCLTRAALSCDAYFLDLDGDGRSEIVLVYGDDKAWWASVMKQGTDRWYPAATLSSACPGSLQALRSGHFSPAGAQPAWRDLVIGGRRLSLSPVARPAC